MESAPAAILIFLVAMVFVVLKWLNRRDPVGKTTMRSAYEHDTTPPHPEPKDTAEIESDVFPRR